MKGYQWKMVQEDKTSRLLFLLCWFAYFSAYLGRLNYSVALAGMVESQMFSKPDAGLIGTTYFLMYGIGQIVNGFLGDRLSPFKLIFCGLLFSALSNLFMGLCSSFVLMAGIWGVNGLAQSMLWSPILAIFANMLQNQHRQKACIHISTTVPVGTLVSYLLSVWVMSCWGWQSVFFVAFAALIFAAAVWGLGGIKITKELTDAPLARQTVLSQPSLRARQPVPQKGTGLWPLLLGSGVLLMMLPVAIQGILKDGVATWIPTMISETFSVPASFAVILTMTLPFANLLGAYAGNFCNRKWLKNEMVTSSAFFLLCLGGLGVLLAGGSAVSGSVSSCYA